MGVPPNRCTHCCIYSTFADIITYLYLLGPYLNQLWNEDIIVSTGTLFYVWFKGGSLASSHPIPISLKAMWQRIEYWQPSTSHPRSGSRCGTRTYGSVLGVEENIVWKKFGRVKAEKNLRSWNCSANRICTCDANHWVEGREYTQYLISIILKTCLNTCKYTLGRANYKKLETSCLRDLPIASPSKLRNKRPPKTETIIIKPAAGQALFDLVVGRVLVKVSQETTITNSERLGFWIVNYQPISLSL